MDDLYSLSKSQILAADKFMKKANEFDLEFALNKRRDIFYYKTRVIKPL